MTANKTVFIVPKNCPDYQGCGRAWVATRKKKVLAIRYMNDWKIAYNGLPAWVIAVSDVAGGLDSRLLPTASSPRAYSLIGQAAYAAGAPLNSRGNRRRPIDLLRVARELLRKKHHDSFLSYRQESRDYCSQRGTLRSGVLSCCEFYHLTGEQQWQHS